MSNYNVDILTAVCNGENFLEKQLDSVLSQNYDNFRIIICDDNSADNSRQIIENFKKRSPDKIKVIFNEKNMGAKENFFKLLSLSTAEYIMFCDQDDIWDNNKIRLTLDHMKKHENGRPTLVHTDMSVIDENGATLAPSFTKMQKIDVTKTALNELLVQNTVTGCTMMINRKLADIVKYPVCPTLHDWWIALTACLFGQIFFLPEQTMQYRRHSHNIRGAKNMSSLGYILSRAADKTDAVNMLKLGYIQSAELAKLYAPFLSDSQSEILNAYGKCVDENKLKRLMTIKKYGIWKQGIVRKVGQILFL